MLMTQFLLFEGNTTTFHLCLGGGTGGGNALKLV